MKQSSTEHMEQLICPYCGARQETTDWHVPNPWDDVQVWDCDECERPFEFQLDPITFNSWENETLRS